jgi:hypothetical protein
MRATALLIFAAALLTGCISTHMERFIGEDIREVVMSDGPPYNVFDYGDERRVFQFYIGGMTSVLPGAQSTSQSAYTIGSPIYASALAITAPAQTAQNPGCLVNYIAEWRAADQAWVVTEIRYPDGLFC